MIAFGVLLILVAVGAVTVALMAPAAMSPTIEVSAVGLTVLASPLALFVGGAASVVLFLLGFGMVSRGARRTSRTRRELKELRKDSAAAKTPSSTPPAAPANPEEEQGLNPGSDGDPPSTWPSRHPDP